MKTNKLYNWLIGTFILLYILTAGISFFHAVTFFNIGNVLWMSYILAFAFECAQGATLFSILMTDNKKTLLPWIVMIVVTSIQCIGNVYSVFQYMSLNAINYYVYLQKPLLFMVPNIGPEMVMIIIAWIIGALLPIIALLLTSMVANNIQLRNKQINENKALEEDLQNAIIYDKPAELKNNAIWDDHKKSKNKIKRKPGRPPKIKKSVEKNNEELNKLLEDISIKNNNDLNKSEYVPKIINNEEVLIKK